MPPEQNSIDLLLEVRSDIAKLRGLLIGNGGVGLCELVRNHEARLTTLTDNITKLAAVVQSVSDNQTAHRDWHAKPEHMTIQEALAQPGVRFVIVLVVLSLVIIAAALGIPEARDLIKGWLS